MNLIARTGVLMLMAVLASTALTPMPSYADSRMAGSRHNLRTVEEPSPEHAAIEPAEQQAENTPQKTDPPTEAESEAARKAATRTIPPPQPTLGATMDRMAMESLGPLTNPLKGSLGNDMWADSPRAVIQEFLSLLPEGQGLWPAQWLANRVLLSNGDVTMMKNNKTPPPGEDLFTLRLEKLMSLGAYTDAAELFRLLNGVPPHDRTARAGILALMGSGQTAQACLEVMAAQDKPQESKNDLFWPQMDAVCTFILAQSIKNIEVAGPVKPNSQSIQRQIAKDVPGSKTLTALIKRDYYRHNIDSPESMEALSAVERAVLKGLSRFDYSRLKLKKISAIPAPILMTMADDSDVKPPLRMALNIEAAKRGLITPEALGALYRVLAEKPGAPDLAISYNNAAKTENKANRAAIITGVLNGERRQALATQFLPFADLINDLNPQGLSPNALENGLLTMLQAGITPSERWVSAWLEAESHNKAKSRETILLYLANLIPENLPTNSVSFSEEQLKTVFKPEITKDFLALWAVFSGLGRGNQLHNIQDLDVYEKQIDLTASTDYVMQSGSLIEKIRDAAQNGRLGETALLASVALNNDRPDQIHPGIIQEVLKSLETVGLKEEAHHMALGVVLGLKQ